MKKPALLALLLVLGVWDAPAQASAPFVSRLQAKAGQSSVQLSWRTVPGFAGTHRIYRHTLEIDAATFPQAVQVGTVGAAAGAFEDFPPAAGSYYYAVLLDDGQLSLLFVPFRNKTSSPVQVASAAPERGEATLITGLSAEVSGDAVRLSFQSSRGDRELLLFRALQPMRSGEDLTSSPLPLGAGRRDLRGFPDSGTGLLLRSGGRRAVQARQAGARRRPELHASARAGAAGRRPGGVAARGDGGGPVPRSAGPGRQACTRRRQTPGGGRTRHSPGRRARAAPTRFRAGLRADRHGPRPLRSPSLPGPGRGQGPVHPPAARFPPAGPAGPPRRGGDAAGSPRA